MNGSKQDIETQFDELISEHWESISKLCVSCASNTGVPVDDLLQECLVDLWVHFCTLQDESGGPFEPASLILCCRNAISHFKRRFLRHSLLPLDDHLAKTLPDSDTSEYRELLDYLTRNLSPTTKRHSPLSNKAAPTSNWQMKCTSRPKAPNSSATASSRKSVKTTPTT